MQAKTVKSKNSTKTYGHAVVIGTGIGGLAAAQVLTTYFEEITLVDRDEQSGSREFRSGVPQARHAHTLLPLGQTILERLFPGLIDELIENGAILVDNNHEIAFYNEGHWQAPNTRRKNTTISSSRPLLEAAIYRRVVENPKVSTLNGYEVTGLATEESKKRITGVNLKHRHDHSEAEVFLAGDLVVDASGRNSQAPRWLAELGFTPPEEWKVNSFAGYSTRLYQKPAGFATNWKKLYIRPNAPEGTRGGLIMPVEDDLWHVTLIGEAGDYPPTSDVEYLEFARSLPSRRLYEAIKHAQPLGKPAGFRRTENRVRRYDRLPSYLEGFIVMGDAVYTLNPVYAQGMTAAAVGSQALERALNEQVDSGITGLDGLAEAFQRRLGQEVGRLWHSTVSKEWDWSVTEMDDNTEEIYPYSEMSNDSITGTGEIDIKSRRNQPEMVMAG